MDLFEQLSGMDFISVIDLEDKDSEPFDMCVLNVVKYKDGLYILAAAVMRTVRNLQSKNMMRRPRSS